MLPRVNLVRTESADYLLFSTSDAISRTIYSTGSWAMPLVTISQMFLNGLHAPLILDIGANLGAYAIPMAQHIAGHSGLVYAYEPQRIVYYQLCGNTFLNRLDNLLTFNVALGERAGTVLIPAVDYKESNNIGGFSLDQEAQERLHPVSLNMGMPGQEVPMIAMDDLQLVRAPNLIKIDVEGLELQVLKGGRAALERWNHPPMLLEAWTFDWFANQRNQLLDYIQTLGYNIFCFGDEVIAQHPMHPRQLKFEVDDKGTINIAQTR